MLCLQVPATTWAANARGADASTEADQELPGALSWFKEGVALSQQGEHLAARARFERARSLSPNWALPYLEIAVTHLKTDNDAAVIGSMLERAVALGQEMPRAHYLYGVHLQTKGQRTEAIREFVTTLKLRPSMLDARFRLATLFVENGQQEKGIEQYQQVLSQDPAHLGAHRNLAFLQEQAGQLEEAEKHLLTITQHYPTIAYHQDTLARFYQRVGEDRKAKQAFAKAQRLSPDDQRNLRPLPKSRDRAMVNSEGD